MESLGICAARYVGMFGRPIQNAKGTREKFRAKDVVPVADADRSASSHLSHFWHSLVSSHQAGPLRRVTHVAWPRHVGSRLLACSGRDLAAANATSSPSRQMVATAIGGWTAKGASAGAPRAYEFSFDLHV